MGKPLTEPKRRAEGNDWLLMVIIGSGSDIGEHLLLEMMKGNFLADSNEDQFPQLLTLRLLWGEFVKWHLSHTKRGLTGEICAVFVHYLAEIKSFFFRRWHMLKKGDKKILHPPLWIGIRCIYCSNHGCRDVWESAFLKLNCICWVFLFSVF